ncbi:hypothetical protein, partial [Microbacterium saccharophilum]
SFFLARRLLRRHGSRIEFARYAYFTLFAAKRALVDAEFRDLIVTDLFYYQPVAIKLAALARTDEDMLGRLLPLVEEELADMVSPGSPYELTPLITIDEMPQLEETTASGGELEPATSDELEFPESNSAGSFGLVKADMTSTARMHRTLWLVSSVLRDLDQVENLELKRRTLVELLELWGRFITVLSADASLADLRSAVTRHLQTSGDSSEESDEKLEDFLGRSIPAGVAIGGIEMTLSSPKLASVFDVALSSGGLRRSNECVTASLLLLFLLRSPGWAMKAATLVDQAEATWVLTHFFHALCQDAYAQGGAPEDELLALCKALYLKQQTFTSADIRSAHLDQYTQRLRTERAKTRHSRHPA